MSPPYRGSDKPGKTEQVFAALWTEFVGYCKKDARGVFARISDSGTQSRLILAAVATVVTPLISEVEKLRLEVRELREELRAA